MRDKDGISAALLIAEAAAEFKVAGKTLIDRLDELYAQVGVHLTGQVVVDLTLRDEASRQEIKANALSLAPSAIGGNPVLEREDLIEGRHLPPTAGTIISLEDQSRIVIRPSGTEPKIKVYVEVVVPVTNDVGLAKAEGQHKLESLKQWVEGQLAFG